MGPNIMKLAQKLHLINNEFSSRTFFTDSTFVDIFFFEYVLLLRGISFTEINICRKVNPTFKENR